MFLFLQPKFKRPIAQVVEVTKGNLGLVGLPKLLSDSGKAA